MAESAEFEVIEADPILIRIFNDIMTGSASPRRRELARMTKFRPRSAPVRPSRPSQDDRHRLAGDGKPDDDSGHRYERPASGAMKILAY